MKKDKHRTSDSHLLAETQTYVSSLLIEKLPAAVLFHTLEHTEKVVNTAKKIAEKSELDEPQLELLLMAAWLHDIGYCYNILDPFSESIKATTAYLSEKNLSPEKIAVITNCIAATKIPQSPHTLLEKILCDAKLAYLASKNYEEKTELFRKETALLTGKEIARKEWIISNLELLQNHQFFTTYGRLKLQDKQEENYHKTMQQLKALSSEEQPEKKLPKAPKKKADKDNKPTRGIETMFRTASHTHLELGSIADKKANIMITITSIKMSLIISILFRKLEEMPNLIIPTIMLILVCLFTIVFAILATRPVITVGKFSREDIMSKRTNLLFFGNFYKMPLEEYEWGMKQVMKDKDMVYSNMIHDIFYLGQVLGRKYQLLHISYSIFMYGIVLSIIAYAIALLVFPVA